MATISDSRNLGEPTSVPPPAPARSERRTPAGVAAGGSLAESALGLAGIVLTIVGLAGGIPTYMAGIACIVLGVALLCQGASLAARCARLLAETTGGEFGQGEFGGGAAFAGGIASIVLGILALLMVSPFTLVAVTTIVLGAALLLTGAASARLSQLRVESLTTLPESGRGVVRDVMGGAVGAQALIGIAAVVLGIIALAGTPTLVLSLVALLVLSCALFLSGLAVSGKFMALLSR